MDVCKREWVRQKVRDYHEQIRNRPETWPEMILKVTAVSVIGLVTAAAAAWAGLAWSPFHPPSCF